MTSVSPGELLGAHPFFREFGAAHIANLAGCATEVCFDPGTVLFRQGEDAGCFYALERGKIAVEVPAGASGSLTIQTLGDGDVLGWSWLIPPYRWHFDARAMDQTRALALDGPCLREKCEADPALGYQFLKRFLHVMEDRLEATRLQLMDVYGSPARGFRQPGMKP